MTRDPALAGIPGRLWRQVALASHRLLMLDYDGTLAPFRVDRLAARPLPRSLAALNSIAASTHTEVAIISGRPITELTQLLGRLRATLVGEHGWERLEPGGAPVRLPLGRSVEDVLAEAAEIARGLGRGAFVERKRTAVVLHTRGLGHDEARVAEDACAIAWRRLAAHVALSVDRIDGGVEIRALYLNKGVVVRTLLQSAPPLTLGVFVGDDVTDEDGFAALRGLGFGVKVGSSGPGTQAEARLPDCEAVATFLEEWMRVAADQGYPNPPGSTPGGPP